MKNTILFLIAILSICSVSVTAQIVKTSDVPTSVRSAFQQKYPQVSSATWEKEKGNYEASWGGKSGEDNSALFKPDGEFIKTEQVIDVKELPSKASNYLNLHYKGSKISEAEKQTDAGGKISYEAKIKNKELLFDQDGNFVKNSD